MSRYGVLFPEYFDGPTGREIQRLGGNNALVLGAFMMSNRLSNMIGLYRLPLATITPSVTHLKGRGILRAIGALVAADFISYDFGTEFVWVHEMARIRVGLPLKESRLKADDNRVRFINSLYKGLEDNPFLQQFFHRYAKTLHLKGERTSQLHHHMSPLPSPLEAPPKPVQVQSTYVGTSTSEDQDQTYGSGRSTAASRRKSQTPNTPKAEVVTDGAEGHRGAAALRDRPGPDHGRPDDRQLRVGGADQEPARRIGFSLPGSAASSDGGDGRGGAGAGESLGPAAGAVTAVGGQGPTRRDSPASSGSALATNGPRPTALDSGVDAAAAAEDHAVRARLAKLIEDLT